MRAAGAEVEIPDRVMNIILQMIRKNRSLRPHLYKVMTILQEEYDLE